MTEVQRQIKDFWNLSYGQAKYIVANATKTSNTILNMKSAGYVKRHKGEKRKKLDSSIYFMIVFPRNDYPRYGFKNSGLNSLLYFILSLGEN